MIAVDTRPAMARGARQPDYLAELSNTKVSTMTTVLDEVSDDAQHLSPHHIEKRVADWKARLASLYDLVETWLPNNLLADRSATISMHEKLMDRFGVPGTKLPVLNSYQSAQPLAKFMPYGLWILGSNGRVDLYIRDRHFLIIDRAENFAPADWQIATAERHRDIQPFNEHTLKRAFGL